MEIEISTFFSFFLQMLMNVELSMESVEMEDVSIQLEASDANVNLDIGSVQTENSVLVSANL